MDPSFAQTAIVHADSSIALKVMFLVQYPVRWTAQGALHVTSSGRPVHSDTNSPSLGSILAMQQLRNDYSLTFPPLYIARYPFKQLSQLGLQWRERKCSNFETVAKGDSNPGSLNCESGILPLSYRLTGYRAQHIQPDFQFSICRLE